MKKISLLTILAFLFCVSINTFAQTAYQLDAEQSDISVDGTSTLHDWTMTLDKGRSSGEATFVVDGGALTSIDALQLAFEVEGLKSGKTKMDDNAYKALKTSEHPNITFALKEVQEVSKSEEGFLIKLTADLGIAGAVRPVNMTATCAVEPAGSLTCNGAQSIKMTDFEVQPPSIMLGSVKTGDEVTINYRAVFVK